MTLEELTADEAQRLWELYVLECQERGDIPRPDWFTVWLEER